MSTPCASGAGLDERNGRTEAQFSTLTSGMMLGEGPDGPRTSRMILGKLNESLMTLRSPLTRRIPWASDARYRATAFSGEEPKTVCR